MPAPHQTDGRELGLPLFAKGIELGFGIIDGCGLIDSFEIGGYHFAVLPGDKVQAVAHHMNDAQLDLRFRKNALNHVREAGQTIDTGDQDVGYTAVAQLGQHLQPKLGALGLGYP